MKSIQKLPFSQLKEELMNELLEILTNNCIEENEDPPAEIKDLKKYFKKAKTLEDLVRVMSGYGYWDWEAYQIMLKKLVDLKK